MLEVKMIDSGSVVVDDHKLVDAAELTDQCHAEVRLNPTDEVFRTRQLAYWMLRFCHSHKCKRDPDIIIISRIKVTYASFSAHVKIAFCITLYAQGH